MGIVSGDFEAPIVTDSENTPPILKKTVFFRKTARFGGGSWGERFITFPK